MKGARVVAGVISALGVIAGTFAMLFAWLSTLEDEIGALPRSEEFPPPEDFPFHFGLSDVALLGLGMWLMGWLAVFAFSASWPKPGESTCSCLRRH
jgi:hypothetical protein